MSKRVSDCMDGTHAASYAKRMEQTNASSSDTRAMERMDAITTSVSKVPMDTAHALPSKKRVDIIHVPYDGRGFPRPWMTQPWVKVPHPTLMGVHYWFNEDTEESVWERPHGAPA